MLRLSKIILCLYGASLSGLPAVSLAMPVMPPYTIDTHLNPNDMEDMGSKFKVHIQLNENTRLHYSPGGIEKYNHMFCAQACPGIKNPTKEIGKAKGLGVSYSF